jgi:hypothetical protein
MTAIGDRLRDKGQVCKLNGRRFSKDDVKKTKNKDNDYN